MKTILRFTLVKKHQNEQKSLICACCKRDTIQQTVHAISQSSTVLCDEVLSPTVNLI